MKLLISFEVEKQNKGIFDGAFYAYTKNNEITKEYIENTIIQKYKKVFKQGSNWRFNAVFCSKKQKGVFYSSPYF